MMAAQQGGGESWDIDWKYQDGPLEDNGFVKTFSGSASATMLHDGLHLQAAGGYIRFSPSVEFSKKAILEADFSSIYFAYANGFRLTLSNGSLGCHIYVNNGAVLYNNGSEIDLLELQRISENENVKLRMEKYPDKNIVYINGVEVLNTKTLSSYYCVKNALFQQSSGETVLKSLRYKFLEV